LHGALLDTELLAEVYLAMTRGQESLIGDDDAPTTAPLTYDPAATMARPALIVRHASADELAAHAGVMDGLDKAAGGQSLWRKLEPPPMAST
jgi:DNA polymerase-3 subunit epsilon